MWPGLPARSIWLEVALALLSSASIAFGAATPDSGPLPRLLLGVGALLLGVLIALYRRRAPLVPFALSAALAATNPDLTAGILSQPWNIGTANEAVGGLGAIALALVLPGAIGIWQRTRAELLDALRERAVRAESERELMAREAVLSERTRIAREMHDAVGHRVSLMVLQAGAIEMAARDSARVEDLAQNVQNAGRQALDELRRMVGVLRGSEVDEDAPLGPQPGLDDVPRLIDHAREAGMTVELRGDLPAVDPAVGRAAYRIVQEALTNAGKHAPGARVCVTVERPPGELVVQVVNGAGGAAAPVSGGFGLVGLAERVRTLGGRLSAAPRLDGGFAVEAVLPT
jgi:signal transduction histidine kinase